MASIRVSRVGEQIKKELSQLLQRELKDPRIGFVTVTAVEMTGDLQTAKVFISVLGNPEQKQASLEGLEKAKGFIRSEVGRRIQLRHIPEFVFVRDETLEHSEHISKLLRNVNDSKKDPS
ncbi:30S ribosome-binding factor RbfA [Hazenella sp. IB182357]|uniref:Ribosome-binding factor A n=1 Tax=Polycladospora coralii TaxID=2771432 RepID=A0A926N6Q7_9BACL|nr:30S ribosome-binding factor RbfA [Polycladospora coralii]MBD1373474.1 30S ribosome-binding factor RbfA [Polycladospora coralii]MBS7530778.1 30S ribosome-binding factor RbfA [Polycladospora coralii]